MAAGRGPETGGEPGDRFLAVGTVRRPHGIKGELSIALETDRPEAVFRPGRVLHLGGPDGRPSGEQLTVEQVRPFKDGLLLRVVEHPTRTEATDLLRGRPLLIPEIEAEPPAEDEVPYHQFPGMRVVADGRPVGTVREVMESPAGHLLVVERDEARELLIPFVREIVRHIDRAAGTIEIEPPPGLLEL